MATLEGGVWTLATNGNLIYKMGNVAAATIAGLANLKSEDGKVYYVDPDTEETTEITADNGEEIAVTTEEGATSSTIKVDSKILGTKNVTLSLGRGYSAKLVIDSEALVKIAADETDETKSSETLIYTASNGTAVVKANLTAGFLVNSSGTIALYRTATTNPVNVASISGLRKGVAAEYATETAVLTASKDSGEGTITLGKNDTDATKSVLGTTAIAVTNAAIATVNKVSYYLENKYYLALDESKKGTYGYAQNLNLEGYKDEAYWSYSGTTASYKIDSPIGYETTNAANQVVKTVGETPKVYASSAIDAAEVAEGDTKITKIKVTAAKSTTLVTVTGLAKDLDISEDKKIIGVTTYEDNNGEKNSNLGQDLTVTIADGEYPVYGTNAKGQSIITTKGKITVNINKNVLNNATVALAASNVADRKFNADSNILTATDTPPELNIWVINGSTATYKRVQRAYYKPDAADPTKLIYVAQKDVTTYLTISGLKAEALDTAVQSATTTASDGYEPVLITAIEGLAIDKSAEDLAKLYKKNNRGQRLTVTTETPATITIDPKFLDNRNASITASDNFKIVLGGDNVAPSFEDEEWNLSGTKAVLKGDIEAGWIVTQNGKTVTYTKSGENQTLATITGLKTGTKLTANDDGTNRVIGFGNGTSFKQGITINNESLSSNNPVDFSTAANADNSNYNRIGITVSKNVLNGNAAITSNFFDLDLDATNTAGGSVPTDSVSSGEKYWVLGTNAVLRTGKDPYYTLANNKLSVAYKTATLAATDSATLKGLDANVTESDLTVAGDVIKVNPNALDQKNVTIAKATGNNYKLALDGNVTPTLSGEKWEQSTVNGAVTYVANVSGGYKTNSTSTAIVYTPTGEETTLFTITGLRSGLGSLDGGGFSGISLSTADNTVKLSYSALNNANVALKSSYGYDLVIDADVPTSSIGGGSAWVVSGTDAILKQITTPAYYVYDEAKDTLTYKPAVAEKKGRTETTYAKISGLKKGLMMNAAGSAIGYYNADGVFVEGITFEGNNIIIRDKGVLSTTDVKLDKVAIDGKYSISFAENLASEIMPQFNSEEPSGGLSWTVKNKTAYLIGGVRDGYVLNENGQSIKYYKGNETAATIATIANLPASVTTAIANGESGFEVSADDHEIKVGKDVLGNTKLSLTTNIPIGEENYFFTLGDGVQTYEEAVDSADKIWTINSKTSTATYRGSISSAYYALDGTSTAISYTAAGLPDNLKFAEIKGLTNLVTIQDGALKGVEIVDGTEVAEGKTLFQVSSGVLKTGTSVQLKNLNENDDFAFGLSIADDVATPEKTACFATDGSTVTLYEGTTAGYVLDGGLSNLNYSPLQKSDETPLAKINGLIGTYKSSGNAVTSGSGNTYETIDGIDVNGTEITLSDKVLSYKGDVTITDDNNKGYIFALADDVNKYLNGPGWKANDYCGFDLYANTSNGGYDLASDQKSIKIKSAGDITGTSIGSISGIKATVGTDHQIAGVTFDTVNHTITLSKSVLNGKDITLTNTAGYSLALIQDDDDNAGYVAKPEKTNTWTFNDGTATYEQKTTEGYEVDETDGKTISYVKANTIITKINNLSKENVTVSGDSLVLTGGGSAITFDEANNKFIIESEDVLAHKTSSITTTVPKNVTNPGYTLDIANGIAADTLTPVWSKTNKVTTATLNQTTKAGYSLQLDGKKVIYSSDPTVKTLATVTNLKKDVALNESGTIDTDGDPTTTLETETTAGLSYAMPASLADTANPGNISISGGVLDTGIAKLGANDNFKFVIPKDVPTVAAGGQSVFSTTSVNKGKNTTVTYQTVKSPYYSFVKKTDGTTDDLKQIKYNAATDAETIFTVTGLKGGLKANPDGSLAGITVAGQNITFTGDVLGTSNVTITSSDSTKTYIPVIGTGAISNTASSDWKAKQEWINSGTTYTYKTYDKAYYEPTAGTGTSTIKYYAPTAGTTHAIVKGLRSGLTFGSDVFTATEKDSSVVGGTLKLSANELNNTNVTLTNSGDFKLALALDETNTTLAATTTVGSWTTSGTKATLNGKVGVGYILSENANAITYNKAKTNKVLATVTGIVSGATIDSVESGVIYLGKDQLGTSNVVVSGDGYKLAFKSTDEGALQSKTDDPAWIKTAGSTKATFTERTYNGFKLEDNDKTLRYYKNTTDVNHLTINGLKSSIEASGASGVGGISGVAVNTEKKTITISADALAKSNVTLVTKNGEYSDYSLELSTTDAEKVSVKGADSAITYQTFNNGTASILQGKTEGWTRTNAKLITYTKPITSTLATITGLSKDLTFKENLEDPASTTDGNSIEGITVSGTTITLDKCALKHLTNGKSVTLTNGKDSSGTKSTYTLALDTSDATNKVVERVTTESGTPTFTLNKTTAYLKAVTPAGYKVDTDKKGNPIITYYADTPGTTLATITGLPAGCKVVEGKVCLSDGTELLSWQSDRVVKINADYLNNNTTAINLKITGAGAKFASTDNLKTFGEGGEHLATFSKGTMTYKKNNTEGWTVTGGTDSITGYQFKTAGITNLFTVYGLNTSVNAVDEDNGVYVTNDTKTIEVRQNALAGKNITLAMPKGTTAENYYELSIGNSVPSAANTATKQYWENQVEWVNNGKGTATYKLYNKGNYEVVAASIGGVTKNTTIKYIAPTAGTPYATLTGLTNAASIGNSDIDYTNGVVSLTADDLSTKTVVLKTAADPTTSLLSGASLTSVTAAKDFKLDFATGDNGVVESTVKSAVWETTGTTAKLVGTVTKGYILSTDKKSVTYQSKNQDGKTIAQITGLRNGAEVTASDVAVDANDKRISHVRLDAYDLGTTNVALTGAGYALSLGSDVILHTADTVSAEDGNKWKDQTDWVASNGTFTYKEGYDKANWEKVSDTSIKYYAAKGGTDKIAITGLNKDIITADVDSAIAGTESAGAIVSLNSATKIVTLGDEALNRANIAMSKNLDGYTFENVKDEIKSKASDLTGTVSGTTVTVKATQSQGYLITNNSQGFTYYANATTPNIAIISGLTSADYAASLKGNGAAANLDFKAATNTFTLKGEQLSKKVVGVSGTARFSFAEDYKDATINGSAGVDNISVAGSGLSIDAGNGNDYIDLGSSGGNTFLYANGNGNDVIANFTAGTDKIQLKNIGTGGVSIKADSGDALITLKVGKTTGTIRVKDLGNNLGNVSIKASNGDYTYTPPAANGDVLADDNFATTPQLSSIVKGSSGYMVTDDLTADATSLTKTDTTIAYSGDKK